jgi:TolB-like protein
MSGESPASESHRSGTDKLESWKEIAAYLRRGVRTVRRWEKEEGLPVHRHVHNSLGTVFARRPEIDAWLESRQSTGRATARGTAVRPGSGRVMLAVLPFTDLSRDQDASYFADGLTDEMIARLGQLRPERLGVIARTTMMQYRGANKTVREIGQELGVAYVLEGAVRREAGRVRVTAQLIEVQEQSQRWAGQYEEQMSSILSLHRELALHIGRGIGVTLATGAEAARPAPGVLHPEAYLEFLKGRHCLRRFTAESVRRSIDYFRRAVSIAPHYAAAHASLAEAYAHLPVWSERPSGESLPLALESARSALALDPGEADAYAALGLAHANYSWNWPIAERCFRKALELNRGSVSAGQWYAEFLGEMGRCDEALAVLDLAGAHDPLSPGLHASAAFVLWLDRRYEEARARAELALEMEPNYAMALIRLGNIFTSMGHYDEAVDCFRMAAAATPSLLACTSLLGYAHGRAGRRTEAEEILEELRVQRADRHVPDFLLANVALGLGDATEALRHIELEWQARGWYVLLLNRSPLYDALRSDPRFQDLLRRLNFPNS